MILWEVTSKNNRDSFEVWRCSVACNLSFKRYSLILTLWPVTPLNFLRWQQADGAAEFWPVWDKPGRLPRNSSYSNPLLSVCVCCVGCGSCCSIKHSSPDDSQDINSNYRAWYGLALDQLFGLGFWGLFFFVFNQCFISIFLKNRILTILLGLSSMFLQPKSDQTGCSAHGKIYLGTYKYSMW